MNKTHIEHKGKKYEVKEPTIDTWRNIMVFKDLLDENEMYVKLISETTGLPINEVKEADALEIITAGDKLWRHINNESKELHRVIEHKGITYTLVDVNKISFGQYVDIDTFLKKDEGYKIQHLDELAAYLYCESGMTYSQSDFPKRIKAFKDLPIKYVESAVFFLVHLTEALLQITKVSSKSKVLQEMMKLRLGFMSSMGGIQQYLSLRKTKFGGLMRLLLFPLWLVSTILLTSWILIKRKRNK